MNPNIWKPGDLLPMRGAADWPSWGGGQKHQTIGAIPATSLGEEAVASSTEDVKGAWKELVTAAANTTECDWLTIIARPEGDERSYMFDIGVGGVGVEEVVIPDLMLDLTQHGNFSNEVTTRWSFPFHIPAGTRITFRCQQGGGGGGGRGVIMVMVLSEGGFWMGPGYQKAEAWGADASDTSPVVLDPSGTINTEGALAVLTASSGIEANALVISIHNLENGLRGTADYNWLLDVAVGGAIQEEVILENLIVSYGSSGLSYFSQGQIGPFPVHIPLGTRITARVQSDRVIDATERLIGITILALGS